MKEESRGRYIIFARGLRLIPETSAASRQELGLPWQGGLGQSDESHVSTLTHRAATNFSYGAFMPVSPSVYLRLFLLILTLFS